MRRLSKGSPGRGLLSELDCLSKLTQARNNWEPSAVTHRRNGQCRAAESAYLIAAPLVNALWVWDGPRPRHAGREETKVYHLAVAVRVLGCHDQKDAQDRVPKIEGVSNASLLLASVFRRRHILSHG